MRRRAAESMWEARASGGEGEQENEGGGSEKQRKSMRREMGGKRAPRVRETPAQLTAALESRLRELGFHLELARVLRLAVRSVGVHEGVARRAGLGLLLRQIRLRN